MKRSFHGFITCRNVTLPYLTTKRECRQQEVSRPLCRVEYETQNYTTQARKCNEVSVEDCFSIAIPQYNVVSASSRSLLKKVTSHQNRLGRKWYGWILGLDEHTLKKENRIFLLYKEIQSEAVAKSYMRKGFLIYEEMRKYFRIYDEAVSHI
jgi:hypothetical protein